MKRFEHFNELCEENKSIEIQSLGMIIALIADEHDLDLDSDFYEARHKAQIDWLNEQVNLIFN